MAHTIAVLSQKGGTGKTTAVRTLTDAFRRRGVHTLAVDLDPQGNLSDYFGHVADVEPTIADALCGRSRAAAAIRRDVIPANLTLAEAELLLVGKMGRELALRRALAEVADDYDAILIDCPPSLGLLTVNALVAADRALITAEAQYFALQGVEQAIEVVELARDSLNSDLTLLGVLLNVADMRTVHSREALASLRERFGAQVFSTIVRASIAYAESAERAVSILDHRPDLGADYLDLADEVLARMPLLEHPPATHAPMEAAAAPQAPASPAPSPAAQPNAANPPAAQPPAPPATPAHPPAAPAPSPPGAAAAPPATAPERESREPPNAPARERIVEGAQPPAGEDDGEERERSEELGARASS